MTVLRSSTARYSRDYARGVLPGALLSEVTENRRSRFSTSETRRKWALNILSARQFRWVGVVALRKVCGTELLRRTRCYLGQLSTRLTNIRSLGVWSSYRQVLLQGVGQARPQWECTAECSAQIRWKRVSSIECCISPSEYAQNMSTSYFFTISFQSCST